MLQQEITTAKTNLVHRYYLKAKKHGFKFKDAERLYNERVGKTDEIIEDIGERPKPFKVIIAFLCIAIALIFAYIEAVNVSSTIVGAIGIGETASIVIGFAFAASGLVCGDLLSSSWTTDEFSGRKKPTPKLFMGVGFGLIYLCGQYYLASRSGVGTGAELQETVTTLKWFILGIACAELIFGMAFLSIALKIFTLFVARLRTKFSVGTMNRESRRTEEAWQRYTFETKDIEAEEPTPAIVDARNFYNDGGFSEN